ncbi:LacI family transcriptional regulator [Leeia sp. TBRC 13508]|uniref:LacI family transcriptional regulator n=1 Tax=Leeia speluncae TaxID=2884804 RepID=A0ABS8D5L7_9NEIS|nr:LacI family DNA-binding transcriptional regulator [Leeia speluncae]MCB6183266.1 LacI family transcriptional regulator [Leeia speluncae]
MATIKDVALHAGVSVTTVSHALNGTRFVSEEAKQRIETAVATLGYVPSAIARSLKHNSTRTLGMMIPNNSNPYFAEIIRGVESQCFDAGYNLVLCNSDNDPEKQSCHLRVLAERRIDGLILVASGAEAALASQLESLNVPLVLVDRNIIGLDSDLVQVDHTSGSKMATDHLIQLGHRNIACISGPAGLAPSTERRAGWKLALQAAGIDRREGDVARGDFTSRGGFNAMQTLLARNDRPTAVFVCNDVMAIGAMSAIHQAGLSVPGDISIVGFDDIELAAYTIPPLTTIAQPKKAIGVGTAELLLERLSGGRTQTRQLILQPELIVRQSSAAPSTLS